VGPDHQEGGAVRRLIGAKAVQCLVGRLRPPVAFLLLLWAAIAQADDALWSRLRDGGLVVMIRHATAPGVGDPPGFRLGDCATQRNLSDEGRAEARRIGEAFRRERVPIAEVRSSEWCRCRETAALAFGSYAGWPSINSFFGDRTDEPERTAAVRAVRPPPGRNIVLVTHQVNITAASGVYPASGEIVVLQPGGADRLEVVGRLLLR
jgi:phosphohistidine phosphatase SixA